MEKIIKIFLTELDLHQPAVYTTNTFAFWSMSGPVSRNVPLITQSIIEKEVLDVFEVQCAGVQITDRVQVKVFDENNQQIFGGYITKTGELAIHPIAFPTVSLLR